MKSILTNHLDLEDLHLYPKLKSLATKENGDIITSFFNQSEKDLETIHISSDFTKIIKLLEVRIQKEEKGLYPLYDKLVSE